MKKGLKVILALATGLCCNKPSRAQHTEYNFSVGSGLFHYVTTGQKDPFYSMINTTLSPGAVKNTYANNPRGNRSGFPYQLSLGFKRVTRHQLLWGVNATYESLQSEKKVNWIFDIQADSLYKAKGHCSLRNNYIVLNPYAGYRFKIKETDWDVMGGIDFAKSISPAHQRFMAIVASTGQPVTGSIISRDYEGYDPLDLRAHFRTQVDYKKWGIYAGYAWGFFNVEGTAGIDIPLTHTYSRYFNMGVSYKIK